ncbi:MFS transporter [Herbiconiux sp. L3-i23]|uniref:MFS transporter n=1 Tax=Herbiconiux sp. L3-i23 TaxID=2905871 RepID=UPI0020591818|nr:MFS transporter [Herbiconiux sp. L3-i23]BDI22148.1 MFS transporter [Herbiconiux sp. L3-i23]
MPSSHLIDITPLRKSPAYARLWAGQAVAGIGGQMTIVTVGLHIYDLTQSTLMVSFVGVIALLPTILAGLYGGALADAFDRRTVALVAAVVSWLATGTIATLAWLGLETVGSLYALTAITAASSTVLGATLQAITPRLLPRELLPAAAALGGISGGISVTIGPAVAGVLVALTGFAWTYSIDVVLFLATFAGILLLPRLPPEHLSTHTRFGAIADGLRFIKDAPNIRMNFLVDIVAMVFGQPRVLFPAAGALLLGGDAITVGVLTAAFAIGALLGSTFSGRLTGLRMHGIAIRNAIRVYGVFIAAFGVVLAVVSFGGFSVASGSTDEVARFVAIGFAALMLAGAGASDEISAIFRSTMLQAAVPDHYRGRIQGLFIVVVSGGPRIGDLYVGTLSLIGLLWLPPFVGGIIIVLLVSVLVARARTFKDYDALHPVP